MVHLSQRAAGQIKTKYWASCK